MRPRASQTACGSMAIYAVLSHRASRTLIAQREASVHAARHDDLTGLLARAAFVDELDRAMPDEAVLMLCDIDGFKAINDGFGHTTGDAVLQAIADRLPDGGG